MGRNGLVMVLLFLFMIFFGQSNAFDYRKLVEKLDPNGSSNANQVSDLYMLDSPSASPPPDDKKPGLSSVKAPKSNDSSNTTPSNVESKGLNNANTNRSSENSSDLELNQGKNQDGKDSKTFAGQSCKGLPICSDHEKTMIACIQDFLNIFAGSDNLSLVVQNEKDVDLKVNITFGTTLNNSLPPFKIPAHGTKEVNITLSGDKSNKVILNAGNGDCELQISQPKTLVVNSPPKSEDLKNVSDPIDSPVKPKDVDNPVESPTKPKEEITPSKDTKLDSPSEPKKVDDPSKSKSKDVENPSKEVNDPSKSKSKDVVDPSKSKDVADPSKSKSTIDPSKSKDVIDPSKSKDANDPSKSKDTGPPSNPQTSVDTPISQNNFLDQLTVYSKRVTPIYGAYLAFLVALIIGGSWALCTFRKRRSGNGVPYQELEMEPTEPSNTVDVETAEGWDHDWDDDWDEDEAIRSSGGGVVTKSISSNGLTSRATKKDGWDADWDD
ncbi:hypothetical protein SSX86_010402 [Deinandra increscens subsp. villosa]|uniref:DUF7356 domain-containing protein n=1 Tax=Deinandra increscens subsp. villosa TaxID=3103831 RepID=A0AAP0H2E0_9ASTR